VILTTAPATLAPVLLAHQGGWDEILFVLVPIAAFVGLLAIANRRAARAQAEAEEAEADAARRQHDPPVT
jgi:hypothetical protein